MKKKFLLIAVVVLGMIFLNTFHSEQNTVIQPADSPRAMPTEGAVYETPAPISAVDYTSAYRNVIERYRTAKQANISGAGDAAEYDVSEWIAYYEHVGFTLQDLDNNGISELIIAGIGQESEMNPVIFELYTLDNNTPVQLTISWARSRKYLLPDNRILNEGSNGASSSGFILFKVSGTKLEFLEGYWSSNSSDYTGDTMYHTTTDEGNPGFGNFDAYDYTMPAWEGFAFGEEILNTALLPQLTMIV